MFFPPSILRQAIEGEFGVSSLHLYFITFCKSSITFSSGNDYNGIFVEPRLVGDLIYLDVVTLEGNKFCITGTTKMFYVNSSSGNTLDPKPSKTNFEATTLVGLLQKISAKFKKGNITWFKHCFLLNFKVG